MPALPIPTIWRCWGSISRAGRREQIIITSWDPCPLSVVTRKCSYRPRSPEKFKDTKKWLKSDFWSSGQSDSKVTKKWLKSDENGPKSHFWATLESLLSNFWDTLAGAPKVTFESLFCVFEFFGVSGTVGALRGHNLSGPSTGWVLIFSSTAPRRTSTSSGKKTVSHKNVPVHMNRKSRAAGREGGGFKPCPSFPWSSRKHQGKPRKHQGFFSPCESSKTL